MAFNGQGVNQITMIKSNNAPSSNAVVISGEEPKTTQK